MKSLVEPTCYWNGCKWQYVPSLSIWAEVPVPPNHVIMISFPGLDLPEYGQNQFLTLYAGGRPPLHSSRHVDFMFPLLLTETSVHLNYRMALIVFRMLFTLHLVCACCHTTLPPPPPPRLSIYIYRYQSIFLTH